MKKRLSNGLTVIFKKKNNNSVTLAILAKTGSNYEIKGKEGISHFIEHLLFEGTQKRTSQQITNAIESLGGDINAFTSHEETVYFISIPKKHFDVALEILSDMIQNPRFDEKIIEKERKVILEEINLHTDDPKSYQWILFLKNLYEKHPIRNPIYGSPESMKSITRDDILKYYNKYYQPSNLIFSIVGNIKNPVNKVEKAFRKFKNNKLPEKIIIEELTNKSKTATERRKILHSYLVLGYKTSKRTDNDFYVLEVIRAILGRGQSGKLFDEIRTKRGLAYAVGINHDASLGYGYFAVYVGMDKKNIKLVKDIIVKELKKLENITDKDIKDAKTYLEGNFLLEIDDNRKEAVGLVDWEMIKNHNLIYRYVNNIKKVTKKDIIRVAKKYLNDKYTLVTIEP
ncbi:insulinase family protein [Candidatus Woesearchaeota archaeon]|nr:insulinase family protein [Candidatus Woesearchaeota archaeon]